jgi:hypothetical protein
VPIAERDAIRPVHLARPRHATAAPAIEALAGELHRVARELRAELDRRPGTRVR